MTTHTTHRDHDCDVDLCDGTRLGHQLATEFPQQTRRFHDAMERIAHPEDHVMPENLQVEHEHVWTRVLCETDETCHGCGATRPDGDLVDVHAPTVAELAAAGPTGCMWPDVDADNEPTLWAGDRDHPTAVLRRCENPVLFHAVLDVLRVAGRLEALATQHHVNADRATAYAGAAAGIRQALTVEASA